jgi:hypothetical protein
MTKTDPLSIKNRKRRPLKSDGQNSNFSCKKDCKFSAKEIELGPGVSGSGKDSFSNPVDLEGEMSAGEWIDSGNARARDRQVQDKTKPKTGIPTEPKGDPNQVRVTLTTLRNAQGQITGTRSSRSLLVPAQLDMNPPDLRELTEGDEEYLLIKVSKERKKMWVTYLNGDDPDGEHEHYWGLSVNFLVGEGRAPDPPRLSQDQRGELRGYEKAKELKKSSRDGTHTRFQRQASESGGERCVPRDAAISLARRLPPQREDLSSLTSFSTPFGEPPSGDGLLHKAASESGVRELLDVD